MKLSSKNICLLLCGAAIIVMAVVCIDFLRSRSAAGDGAPAHDTNVLEQINEDGTTTVIPPNDAKSGWMLSLTEQLDADLLALDAVDSASALLTETGDSGLQLAVTLKGADLAATQEEWEGVIRETMAEASVETYALQVSDVFGDLLIDETI